MTRKTKTSKVFSAAWVVVLVITIACPAYSRSQRRRGTSYISPRIEISNISSIRHEKAKSGLIWYSIKANVRNRTQRTIHVTICFQAVDRSGYELDDVCFYDELIKKDATRILSDKTVMDATDYKNTWEWKIKKLRIE